MLIWPRPDSIVLNDTVIFNGYARTSAGVPVTNPLLRWSVVFDNTATALFTGNSIGLVGQSTNRTATVHIRWQTNSGLFRDSLRIRFIERPAPLPWRPGQQALLVVSDTVVNPRDTVWFSAYARTSSGVPVANPSFTYEFTNYGFIAGGQMNANTGFLVFKDSIPNSINTFSIAWTTRSGIFRDSVKIRTVGLTAPAVLPPFNNYPLDTTFVYTYNNKLLPGVISVDSVNYPFQILVKRYDPTRRDSIYHMFIHKQWDHRTYDFLGAIVIAPMDCPMRHPNDAPLWSLRWTGEPDTIGTINVVAPYTLTQSAAAQLPIDSLKKMSRVSMERYLRRDTSWVLGKHIYKECFGVTNSLQR